MTLKKMKKRKAILIKFLSVTTYGFGSSVLLTAGLSCHYYCFMLIFIFLIMMYAFPITIIVELKGCL